MRILKILAFALVLASCSTPLGTVLGFATPKAQVAANVQAGKENTQQLILGQQERIARDQNNQRVQAQKVDNVIVNEEVSIWYWVALIIALLIDSPRQIGLKIARKLKWLN